MPKQKNLKKKGSDLAQTMYLTKNLEAIAAGKQASQVLEFEVSTDSAILGKASFGPYSLAIWDFGMKERGEPRLLCLRVEAVPSEPRDWKREDADPAKLHYRGDIEAEILALASVALRCRLSLGAVVRDGDTPTRYPLKYVKWVDPELIAGTRDLAELGSWLERAVNLKPGLQQRFMLSAKLYQQALDLIETKPDLAYLNLVSAIEVLAIDFTVDRSIESADEELAALLSQIPDGSLQERIHQRLATRHISFIGYRFQQFILAHVEDSFWIRSDAPQDPFAPPQVPDYFRVNKDDLPKLLKRIYNQRSVSLHEGEPFPPLVFAPVLQENGAEYIPRLYTAGREWAEDELLPYPQFFERLVNHVLKNYLVRNQARQQHNTDDEDNKQ